MTNIMNMLNLRLKIMLNGKAFYVLYVIVLALIIWLTMSLYKESEKGMQIPITIVDQDHSRFSMLVIEKIKDNPLLSLGLDQEDDAIDRVEKRMTEAAIVINKGAGKKVEDGDLRDLFSVYHLEDNYFVMMLTDIVSGDLLDEISIESAARFYDEAASRELSVSPGQGDNEVYKYGERLDYSDRNNYYLSIEMLGDSDRNLSWYNENILLKKMTTGIVYIFIGFFMLFQGVELLKVRNQQVMDKILVSPISTMTFNVSEWLALVVSGLMITLPITITSWIMGEKLWHIGEVNFLYVLGSASMIHLLIHIFRKIESYLLLGSSVLLGVGIASGSFFAIDYSNPFVKVFASLFPNFYSMNAYFDKSIIREYSVYTTVYVALLLLLCLAIDKYTLRSTT